MKSYSYRLDRLTEAITPRNTIALCMIRYGLSDDDFNKQHQEYEALHGSSEGVKFLCLTDYSFIESESYEEFIERSRRKCSGLYCWWPELPALKED